MCRIDRVESQSILFILFILSRRGDLMAITNYERVGKALELLRDGLRPFVARELESKYGKYWITTVTAAWPNELVWREGEDAPQMDAAVLLRMMWDQWNAVFREHPGLLRAQPGQRAARGAQQVGAPGAVSPPTMPIAAWIRRPGC